MDYLVFLALTPLAAGTLAAVGVAVWRRKEMPESRALLALLALGGWWLVSNAVEVLLPWPGATYLQAQLTYVFTAFVPAAWLAFAWVFTHRAYWLRSWAFGALLAFDAAFLAAVLTNPLHGLVWRSVAYVPSGPFLGMTVEHGPVFFVYVAVNWSVMGFACVLILREAAGVARSARHLSVWIAVGALIPLAVNVAYVAGVLPFQKDFTPLALAIAAVSLAVGIVRYRFLLYRPVARTALVEGMREGLLVLDLKDRVVDSNPALRDLLGVADGVVGLRVSEAVGPRNAGVLAPLLGEREARGEVTLDLGGRVRTLELRVSPLTDRRGILTGRLVLFHDISDRLVAEAALRRANAELEAHNGALDAFAHTVAHDLKGPIHTLMGYAEILKEDGASMDAAERAECADTILRTALKMDGIVQGLLLLAGVNRQPVEPEPIDMGSVVDEALERLRGDIERAGASVERPDAWPAALGYAPWIEEVWVNYVGNALKYGGSPPRITLGAEAGGGVVRFWVRDEGPGLTPAACATVFEPFTRVRPEVADGHGLGLSIVRRITDRLGGACGVESTGVAGEGARFHFTLPEAPGGWYSARAADSAVLEELVADGRTPSVSDSIGSLAL